MSEKDEPKIGPNPQKQDYTAITFYPDLEKFRMKMIDNDIFSLFMKRAYDLAGVTPEKVQVVFNGQPIKIKNFDQYSKLYLDTKEADHLPKIVEKKHQRWEIVASLSDGKFE